MKINVGSRLLVEAFWAHIENVNPNPSEESISQLLTNSTHVEVQKIGNTLTEVNDQDSQVNQLLETFKEASLFGAVGWFVTLINEKEKQQNGGVSKLGKELQTLINGFEQYCIKSIGDRPREIVISLANQEKVNVTNALLRDIISILFLRYLTDKNVVAPYPEVKEVVDKVQKVSIADVLSQQADNVLVGPEDLENVSGAIVSFAKKGTLFLRIGGAKGLKEIIERTIGDTKGMVKLLSTFTGWKDDYCRKRLSGLLKYYAKQVKNNWRGPVAWMIKKLYEDLRYSGATKTQAGCFLHNLFEPVIPIFTSRESYNKRHPEEFNYNYRQHQLREVRKFAMVK